MNNFVSPNEKGITRKKIKAALLLAIWTMLFFQAALQDAHPSLKLLDELIVIGITVWACCEAYGNRRQPKVRYKSLIIGSLLFLISGIISTVLNGRNEPAPIVIDLFTSIKFVIVLIATSVLVDDNEYLRRMLVGISKMLIAVMLVFAIASQFVDIGMAAGYRYMVRSFKFVYPHPTYVVQSLVGSISLLIAFEDKNRLWISAGLIVCLMTMRAKAAGYVVFCIAAMVMGRAKGLRISYVVAMCTAVLLVGMGALFEYYGDVTQARYLLMATAIKLAIRYFPFGVGFGAFGSSSSIAYYSPFYAEYGLDQVHGLSPTTGNYATDSFWATLLGQFGLIGVLTFFFMLFCLWKLIKGLCSGGPRMSAAMSIAGYMILSSFGESAFFTPFSAVYLMFCLAVIMNIKNGMESK